MAEENVEGLEGLEDFGEDFGDQLDSFMEGEEEEGGEEGGEEGEEDRGGESEYGDFADEAVFSGDDPVDVEEDEDRAESEHTDEESEATVHVV